MNPCAYKTETPRGLGDYDVFEGESQDQLLNTRGRQTQALADFVGPERAYAQKLDQGVTVVAELAGPRDSGTARWPEGERPLGGPALG